MKGKYLVLFISLNKICLHIQPLFSKSLLQHMISFNQSQRKVEQKPIFSHQQIDLIFFLIQRIKLKEVQVEEEEEEVQVEEEEEVEEVEEEEVQVEEEEEEVQVEEEEVEGVEEEEEEEQEGEEE